MAFSIHRRGMLASVLASLSMPVLGAKLAAPKRPIGAGGVTIILRDLSPRFLDFYTAAQGASPDERFRIWKDRYDYAATPPTPEGDAVARRLLDAAWPRYPAALRTIRAGAEGMEPDPLPVLTRLVDLLEAPRPIAIGLTTYVGGFEENAFTADMGEGPVVSIPLEIEQATRAMLLPHEMTHAVHGLVAKLSPGYERTLGRVIFEEGLAMRAVQRLHPGLPDHRYVGGQPWYEAAMAQRGRILAALLPALDAHDGATVFKYTMGTGSTGREREAYIAGWLAVGALLARGATFAGLARIPEAELPQTVRQILVELMAASATH